MDTEEPSLTQLLASGYQTAPDDPGVVIEQKLQQEFGAEAPPTPLGGEVVVGQVWIQKPTRKDPFIRERGGKRKPARVVVTGYKLRRVTQAERDLMARVGRSWTGWTVRFRKLEESGKRVGARGSKEFYLREERFRERYRPRQERDELHQQIYSEVVGRGMMERQKIGGRKPRRGRKGRGREKKDPYT